MRHAIRGSEVYVSADIERILTALAGAARRYSGDYAAGYADALRDVAAGVGATVDAPQVVERVREVVEYRAERTVERYQAPAERQFKVVGQRQEPPQDMTGDDVNVTVFNAVAGRLVERQQGYGWLGNDGNTAYWDKCDWQLVAPAEYEQWGGLLPDGWAVLVRHIYADRMRRQLGQRKQLR